MERSKIRDHLYAAIAFPHCASLHAGYELPLECGLRNLILIKRPSGPPV
jgi:hypothetical protein